ncbi:MAG: TIGR04372 family glycosyltransferase [Sulfuricella sp.]
MADLMLMNGKPRQALDALLSQAGQDTSLLKKIVSAMRQTGDPFQVLLLGSPCDEGKRLISDANGLEEQAHRLHESDQQKWQGEIHLLRGIRHALSNDQLLAATLLGKWIMAPTRSRVSLPGTTNPAFLMVIDFSSDSPSNTAEKTQTLLAMAASFSQQPRTSACFVRAFASQLGMDERYERALDMLKRLSGLSPEIPSPQTKNPNPDGAPSPSILTQVTQGARQQELAVMLHQAQINSFYYTIDIVGACNLKCASCPNGNSDPSLQKHGLMSLDTFRQIIEKIRSERAGAEKIRIDLYNWGEPCQHPQLPEFIRMVKEAGYKCGISCNLSRAKNPEALIAAQPDFIRVSLSGFEQSVYGQTHNGGDIESVKNNLNKLRAAIDRLKANTIVQVGYLLYRHNCGNDLTSMRHLCDELDFLFSPAPAMLMPLEKLLDATGDHVSPEALPLLDKLLFHPKKMRALAMPYRNQHTGCSLRTGNLSINFDGSVPLCCAVYDKKYDIVSNYLHTPEKDIQKQRNAHPLCAECTSSMSDLTYNGIRFPGFLAHFESRVEKLHHGQTNDRAGEKFRHPAIYHEMLALIEQSQERHEEALQELADGVQAEPERLQTKFLLAKCQKDLGHFHDALESSRQILSMQPNFQACLYETGLLNRVIGDIPQAIKSYEKYISVNPVHARAHYNLGILHQINEDHDNALRHFRKCLEISPYFLTCLGRVRDYEEICHDNRFLLGSRAPLDFMDMARQLIAQGIKLDALLYLALSASLASGISDTYKEMNDLLAHFGASKVKFSFLVHTHIGHLAANTDLFIRNKALGKTPDDTLFVFLAPSNPANKQLLEMIKRQLPVIESSYLYYLASELLSKKYQHPLFITGNEYFEYQYSSSSFTFTEEEEVAGAKYLEGKGLNLKQDWFTCIFARDHVYSSSLCEKQEADPITFRNADISSYQKAVQHILDKGGFVFRIGSQVEKPLGFSHPKLIDYSMGDRTDFLDIYLIAKCRFIMGSNSGICDAARIFDTPYLGINTTPLDWKPYGKNDLFIPKKIRDELTGRFLTLKEFFSRNGINGTKLWSDKALKENSLAYTANSEAEILEVTKEMIARLDGIHEASVEDDMLQAGYHNAYWPNQTAYPVRTPIGQSFIRQNQFLCD